MRQFWNRFMNQSAMPRPRIGYFGEQSADNLGDVAVYAALREHPVWSHLVTLLDDCSAIDLRELRQRVQRVDSVLIGGGTQISALNTAPFEVIAATGKPVATFGTGVGSCGFCESQAPDLSALVPFLRRTDPLAVRGPISQESLRELGMSHARVVGDAAFGYARHSTVHRNGLKRVCVCLAFPSHADERLVFNRLFHVIGAHLRSLLRDGWQVDCVVVAPGDVEPSERFVFDEGLAVGSMVRIYRDPCAYMEYVRSATMVLCIRLHAAVLAACAGVPFVLVGYREKCLDFVYSLRCQQFVLNPGLGSEEDLRHWLECIVEAGAGMRRELLESVRHYLGAQDELLLSLLER